MEILTAAAPPFFKNGYVVICDATREAVLIDPGDEVETLLEAARQSGAVIKEILLTHAHLDHVTGVGRAKAALGVPVWLHKDDLFLYDGVMEQAAMFGLTAEPQPPVDRFYQPGERLRVGRLVIDVRHTPGHCPGGVCLAIGHDGDPDEVRELFVGDTLFQGSIGRTDLPGGDLQVLLTSIRQQLLVYPDATIVHSGHGPDTTVGEEKASNPFLR
jgi:glyoxylase-like metal-dependent hydrolase (beta-lactamase superfamily II)